MIPTLVYLFHNGQVMSFDKRGEQMPEWQGPFQEIISRLLDAKWKGTVYVTEWKPS
jgi:hypothetical protein